MALTRTQIRDYIKAKLSELDSQRVTDLMLNIDINLSIRKVQRDLMGLGMKYFTKTTPLTGAAVAIPSDLLSSPNSIIDIKASTGSVRAFKTISYTTPTADLTHTYLEPGTGGNSVTINCDAATFGAAAASTVKVTISNGQFYFDFGTSLTCTQIAALFNADPIYKQYFYCSTTTGSATPVPSVGTAGVLATGAGSGWYPAREISIEDYNRISNNLYLAPSATDPAYVRLERSIHFIPKTITYSLLCYYYQLADLSADTDTNPLPVEHEELLLMDLLTKTYTTLKQNADSQAKAVEYETKVKELENKYVSMLTISAGDKARLQSNDQLK